MKILITTEFYTPAVNGVVTSIVNLCSGLTKLGHEVRILTLSETNHSYKKNNVTYIGSIGAGKIYPGARMTLPRENRFVEELINWHPDIIHTQSEFSTFLIAKQIANVLQIPIVHTYHTVYENYTHYFSPIKAWGKSMASLFTNKILGYTDCVIAPTEKVYELLKSYNVNPEIKIVPTGLELERFKTKIPESEKENLKKQLNIPADNKILVFVGRLAKEKNLDEIILFLSKLKRKDLTLLVVGDGPSREFLENYAMDLGIAEQVVFTGMVPSEKTGIYYQIGDVFVSASVSEAQGLTYIEALASGLPAICRRDPCLKNVITNGLNGWQYENFEQFKQQLDVTLDSENIVRFKKNASESDFKDFSLDNFAKKVETIYIEITNSFKENEFQEVI